MGGSSGPAAVWAFGTPLGSSMIPIEGAIHHRGSNLQHQSKRCGGDTLWQAVAL